MDEKMFIEAFAEALEVESPSSLSLTTEFQKLDEWDSMAYLSVIAMLDEKYDIQIENADFIKFVTIGDIVKYISSNK
ncbi:acyl carrier protein [Bacteroides caecimuris]|jgi:acyl carrier protein|uniref:acyl carrier protein n=1 Tax=Bacteroides caecimuris TaxID=1796613 RepID=UPI00256FD5DB|nr:acyl carrier protein [Bacteroides caecimuris]